MKKKIKNKKKKNILLLFGLLPIMVIPLAFSISCSQNATTNPGFNQQKLEEVSNDINKQIMDIKNEPLYFDSETITITEIKKTLDLKLTIDKNNYGYDLYDLTIDKTNSKLKVSVNVFDINHPSFPKVIKDIELPYQIVSAEEKLLKENADDFEKQVLEMKYHLIISNENEVKKETVEKYLKENTIINSDYNFNVKNLVPNIQNGKFNVTIDFYSNKNSEIKESIEMNDLNYEIVKTDQEELDAYADIFGYQILVIKNPLKVSSINEINESSVEKYIRENTKINPNYDFYAGNILNIKDNKFDVEVIFHVKENDKMSVGIYINSLKYEINNR